ncbi:MAG: response regulator [Gammaproteobacteria bacterium]
MREPKFKLLHGEDDAADVVIMQRILKDMQFQGTYQCFSIGQDVVDWILKRGRFAEASHGVPDLVILDIGLPGINGKEILHILRTDEITKYIPIIMMSGSVSERDYQECVALGCNGYVQKNESLKFMTETCHCLIRAWMNLVRQRFV